VKGKKGKAAGFFPAAQLLKWYAGNRRDLPWRLTRDPYAILVSEVMLQQTQVKTVIAYYRRWMEAFPNAATLAAASEEKVLKLWEGLGYYRRARNLQAAARAIRDEWNGRFPGSLEGLLSLPGIGRYTAGALGSIAFGWKLPVVDGNVSRVLARYLGIRSLIKTPAAQKKLWAWMEAAIPAQNPGDFNQAMMELGAMVCLPRAPKCGACPLHGGCWAQARGRQEQLPRTQGIESVGRVESAVVLRENGSIWLVRRRAGEWHEGLWALPSVMRAGMDGDWREDFRRRFGIQLRESPLACSMRYQVTHHRIDLRVFEAPTVGGSSGCLRRWKLGALAGLPMVTSHRRGLERLQII